MIHLSSHVKVTHRIAQNCPACKLWHEKTLDKRRNFIKLKNIELICEMRGSIYDEHPYAVAVFSDYDEAAKEQKAYIRELLSAVDRIHKAYHESR